MLRQSKRIRGKNRVSQILDEGQKIHSVFFVMRSLISQSPEKNERRYAAIVGKKISKLAVVRNKKRRQMYEAIQKLEASGLIQAPEDHVLIARSSILSAPFDALVEDLKNCFAKNARILLQNE